MREVSSIWTLPFLRTIRTTHQRCMAKSSKSHALGLVQCHSHFFSRSEPRVHNDAEAPPVSLCGVWVNRKCACGASGAIQISFVTKVWHPNVSSQTGGHPWEQHRRPLLELTLSSKNGLQRITKRTIMHLHRRLSLGFCVDCWL